MIHTFSITSSKTQAGGIESIPPACVCIFRILSFIDYYPASLHTRR